MINSNPTHTCDRCMLDDTLVSTQRVPSEGKNNIFTTSPLDLLIFKCSWHTRRILYSSWDSVSGSFCFSCFRFFFFDYFSSFPAFVCFFRNVLLSEVPFALRFSSFASKSDLILVLSIATKAFIIVVEGPRQLMRVAQGTQEMRAACFTESSLQTASIAVERPCWVQRARIFGDLYFGIWDYS